MEKNKTNNKLVIFLLIIIILLLVGGGYIVYTLLSDNPNFNLGEKDNSNSQLSGDETEDNNLPDWANYLLKQNITEITYETGSMDDNYNCISKTMTKAQLTDVLIKMTAAPLKKYRSGGGGGPCDWAIRIKYDDKTTDIWMGNTITKYGFDNELLNLVEKEKYTLIDDQNLADTDWYYTYEWDTTYLDSLFDDTNTKLLESVEIKNAEVKKLYEYVKADLDSNYVCLGWYYQNPYKNHTLKDKVALALINYAGDYEKKIDADFLNRVNKIDGYRLEDNSLYYIEADVVRTGMKLLFNIDVNEFKDLDTYWLYTYRKEVDAFVSGNGGGDYQAKPVQQIIEYNELKDEINLTVIKAELGFDNNVYRYVNNEDTLVYKGISMDNFKFSVLDVDKFPRIKYIFKKNSSGKYYLSDIVNLNFTEDFERCSK